MLSNLLKSTLVWVNGGSRLIISTQGLCLHKACDVYTVPVTCTGSVIGHRSTVWSPYRFLPLFILRWLYHDWPWLYHDCVMTVLQLYHDCVMTPYRSVINCIMAGHGRTFFIGCIFFRAVMRVVNNKTPSWKGIFLRKYSTFFLEKYFLETVSNSLYEKVFSWKSIQTSSRKSIFLKK